MHVRWAGLGFVYSCMPKCRCALHVLYHMPESTERRQCRHTELASLHLRHSWDDSGGNAVRALVTDQQNRVRPLPSP